MTKQNKYSGKAWAKPNRGSKTRHMAKHPLGKVELPWHYDQMVENFGSKMDAYHESKIAQHAEKEEGVVLNIVYDKEEDIPKGPRESGYDIYQK
jgi:hypothetical protein